MSTSSGRSRHPTQPAPHRSQPSGAQRSQTRSVGRHFTQPTRHSSVHGSAVRHAPLFSSGTATPSVRMNLTAGQSDQHGDADEQDEIVMAVNYTDRRTVGCAYYVARERTLYLMEDLRVGDPGLVETLKLYIRPTNVLHPANCPSELVKCLDLDHPELNTDLDNSWTPASLRLPYLLDSRPSREFSYDSGKHKLANLDLGHQGAISVTFTVPGDVVAEHDTDIHQDQAGHRQGQLLRLAALVNTDSNISVGCAGAILAYILRRRTNAYLPGDAAAPSMFSISKLQMFTLADTMLVSFDTLQALQIISTESHPNAHQQGPSSKNWSVQGAKEGLSVFGLFLHQAKTPQGRTLLRQCFLRPSMKLEVINERLDTIALLLRPENTEHLDQLVKHLAKIKNMRTIMTRMQKGISLEAASNRSFASSTFARLRHFSYHALCITDVLREIESAEHLPIVKKIQHSFDTQTLASIGRMISNTVDLETSQEQHRVVIQHGVDTILDDAKRMYESLESLLSRVAEFIAEDIPSELKSGVSVIFFPQIGFLVSVRLDPRTNTGVYEGLADDRWERMFLTEANAYYKSAATTQLDEEYGDVYGKMCDREIEIAQKLSEHILQSEDLICTVSDICGELDCLTALACGARDLNLVRPEMTTSNTIEITGGRHILQELTVPVFVANDTTLAGGDETDPPAAPSMLIMTGPNYSGKTIYLKQVALITYMAHVGSFVPAQSARIGLTDKILTRIATRETLSRSSSAFMTDLQQISIALNTATRRSLLIIDEFGKGTDAADGAGLAAGVFEHLLGRGTETPKVLAATHWHEVFECGFLRPGPLLAFAHMEVRVDEAAEQTDQQITHLYTYRPGRSMQSFGTCCATMNGIPSTVVARAERLILLAARGCDLVEACAEMPDREIADLDKAEHIARRFLATDRMLSPRDLLDDLLADITEADAQ